jgi:hypothetical protein
MANTDYKIEDFRNNKFNFTFPTGIGRPNFSNLAKNMNYQITSNVNNMISTIIALGFNPISIGFQGVLQDQDRYEYAATVMDQSPKKLWLGEDSYYYVLPQNPNDTRTTNAPNINQYAASFIAADPRMYLDSLKYSTGNTISSANNQGYFPVLPIFWVSGTTSQVIIKDPEGRTLTFTPPTTDTWIIFPYFWTQVMGFVPATNVAFKLLTTKSVSSDWALDFLPYGKKSGSPAADFDPRDGREQARVSFDSTNYYRRIGDLYKYPQAYSKEDTVFTITVGGSPDPDPGNVSMQWKQVTVNL